MCVTALQVPALGEQPVSYSRCHGRRGVCQPRPAPLQPAPSATPRIVACHCPAGPRRPAPGTALRGTPFACSGITEFLTHPFGSHHRQHWQTLLNHARRGRPSLGRCRRSPLIGKNPVFRDSLPEHHATLRCCAPQWLRSFGHLPCTAESAGSLAISCALLRRCNSPRSPVMRASCSPALGSLQSPSNPPAPRLVSVARSSSVRPASCPPPPQSPAPARAHHAPCLPTVETSPLHPSQALATGSRDRRSLPVSHCCTMLLSGVCERATPSMPSPPSPPTSEVVWTSTKSPGPLSAVCAPCACATCTASTLARATPLSRPPAPRALSCRGCCASLSSAVDLCITHRQHGMSNQGHRQVAGPPVVARALPVSRSRTALARALEVTAKPSGRLCG